MRRLMRPRRAAARRVRAGRARDGSRHFSPPAASSAAVRSLPRRARIPDRSQSRPCRAPHARCDLPRSPRAMMGAGVGRVAHECHDAAVARAAALPSGTSRSSSRSFSRFCRHPPARPRSARSARPERLPSASTSIPESSAIAGRPRCQAAWRALISALSRKVDPVSGGDSMPRCSLWRELKAERRKQRLRAPAACRRWRSPGSRAPSFIGGAASRLCSCSANSWPMPAGGKIQQRIELVAPERVALGRALHFDEGAAVVHDDVHVGLGLRVLGVVEIEHGTPAARCRPIWRRPGRAAGLRQSRARAPAARRPARAPRRRR